MITITIAFTQHKTDYYNKYSYYLLSLYSTQNSQMAVNAQDAIVSSGGAGYIYRHDGSLHVLAFAYLSKTDAEKVKSANLEDYDRASVIELTAVSVKSGIKRRILSVDTLKHGFEYMCSLVEEIYNLAIDYDKGEVELSQLFRRLEKIRLELDESIAKIGAMVTEEEVTENIRSALKVSLNVCLTNLVVCRDEVYRNHAIEKNLKLLCVKCCFEEVNLRKTLNSL